VTDRKNLDIDLIDRFLAGDKGAFDTLMSAHEQRVFAICLRTLGDRQAALDATQETFITVFRKADRYKATAAFSTWLYRVTVNTCYDYLRRQKRHRTETLPEIHDPVDVAASDEFAAVEIQPAIEAALAALPDEFRAAVVLVDLHGFDLERAAEILEVPIGTVKSRVYRARRKLAAQLGNFAPSARHQTDETL
jgi:RNA polymerase sigma-70 factor, ECF subfamily